MNPRTLERHWEADCFALEMAASGPQLEARLVKLHRAPKWSRRKLLTAGAALVGLAPLTLVPWRVGAQEAEAEGRSLPQQWEDLLLLEAARYLRLTSGQFQQIRSIVRVTDDRLHKLQDQEAKTQATLQRITDRQRAALLAGKTVSLDEQANALLLEKGLRPARERATQEITEYAAPRLARLLTPDQIARAFLLTNGEMPATVARRPALLDPQSGFVLRGPEQAAMRAAAARRVLAHYYPPAVVEALGQTISHEVILADPDQIKLSRFSRLLIVDEAPVDLPLSPDTSAAQPKLALSFSRPRYEPPAGVDKALFDAAQREYMRLEKLPVLADELTAKGTPADRAEALSHTARRLFTSPRWKAMVDERLQRGGIVAEDEAAPGAPG